MPDPTAGMVRAYEIKVGDFIDSNGDPWWFLVDEIIPLGGDEMGPAVFRFVDRNPDIGGAIDFPYAALVKRI